MPKRKDITGQRFGYLVAVNPTHLNKYKHLLWNFLCDCGKYKEIPVQAVISGRTKSCGCKTKEMQNIKKMNPKEDSSVRSLFGEYRKNAIKRGLSFELSLEQVKTITSQPCYYCGTSPKQVYVKRKIRKITPYIYNGIDRIDNTKGYIRGNVVSCCGICNKMKHSYSIDIFLSQAKKIFSKHSYTLGMLESEI